MKLSKRGWQRIAGAISCLLILWYLYFFVEPWAALGALLLFVFMCLSIERLWRMEDGRLHVTKGFKPNRKMLISTVIVAGIGCLLYLANPRLLYWWIPILLMLWLRANYFHWHTDQPPRG